jgi:hypothetical protein
MSDDRIRTHIDEPVREIAKIRQVGTWFAEIGE